MSLDARPSPPHRPGPGLGLLAAFLVSCATHIPPEDDAGGEPAQPGVDANVLPPGAGGAGGGVGGAGGVGGFGGEGGQGGMVPPGPGGGPIDCAPGQRISLCVECGPDQVPRTAPDDPACPALDCDTLDQYALERNAAGAVCYRERRAPSGGRCLPTGGCRERPDAEYCDQVTRTEVLREGEDCRIIAACAGQEQPRTEAAPAGHPCPGGTCRPDGTCDNTLEERCGAVGALGPICGTSNDPQPHCAVFVEAGEHDNCALACQSVNRMCVRAWTSVGAQCTQGDQVGCIQALPAICGCRTQ